MAVPLSVVTITSANPGVVAWTAHGLSASDPVEFSTTGALPTNIKVQGAANSRVYVKPVDADHFQVVATPGGATGIDCTAGAQSGVQTCFMPSGLRENSVYMPSTFTISSSSIAWTAHGMYVGDYADIDATAMPTNFIQDVVYFVQSVIDADHITLSASYGGAAVVCGASAGTAVTIKMLRSAKMGDQKVLLSNVPLAVTVTITNLVVGSRVRVAQDNDNTELYNATAAATSVSFTTKFAGTAALAVRLNGYAEYLPKFVIGANGANVYVSQTVDGTS
jgi:hypothetical protein